MSFPLDLNTKNRVLEGFGLFGPTKRKLDLPLRSKYDSHRPKNVNYSIPALTQNLLEHALKSPSHMMRMWCLTPPTCWS